MMANAIPSGAQKRLPCSHSSRRTKVRKGRVVLFTLLTSAELWLGVLVGAALVYAAIRVRQRSDDS